MPRQNTRSPRARGLTDAEQTRVLELYAAAMTGRTREARASVIAEIVRRTGFPDAAVRAVITDYEQICGEDA